MRESEREGERGRKREGEEIRKRLYIGAALCNVVDGLEIKLEGDGSLGTKWACLM